MTPLTHLTASGELDGLPAAPLVVFAPIQVDGECHRSSKIEDILNARSVRHEKDRSFRSSSR
jgi:hypothetical protein